VEYDHDWLMSRVNNNKDKLETEAEVEGIDITIPFGNSFITVTIVKKKVKTNE
jgi:hypothetical protein